MKVVVLGALADNYMYLIVDEKTQQAAVVDPVEPGKVIAELRLHHAKLCAVLTTHHHWDHAGGNLKLLEEVPGIPVYGGDSRICGITHIVNHEDEFSIGSLRVRCLGTPCHTTGHICYHVTDNEGSVVFTGDTLFFGGCGKFFEGTAEEMVKALIEILGCLPDSTQVYCGHEYTVSNLKFAKYVEPENSIITEKLLWAEDKRRKCEVTVPSTIGDEKLYNPFMRVNEKDIQKFARRIDPIEVMSILRNTKNEFKAN